ncbi:MAG: DNA polymerase III subunit delta [Nitrospinae bacterium RIFCSPLOWO2_12_FULL_47_7]|nr:MAG: DNA polymerase III subunit delta [Nitrospinae bacterium RIFCSPLOWO2_12_FULL_47_7]
MTAEDLILKIEKGAVETVYFIYGEERFFHTEILNALNRQLITPDNREFNLEVFDAKTCSVGDWLGGARTFSFMGGTKLVIVHNLHEVNFKDFEIESLLAYLNDPAPGTCLAIVADSVDKRKKVFKTLAALTGAVECAAPNEATLMAWLKKRAQAQGYRLSNEAARILVNRVGNKAGFLACELEKALAYAGKPGDVSDDDVAEVVGEIKMENVFALTEALKGKNAEEALRLLHNQLNHNEEPLKILGTIAWQFRLIWEVKQYQKKKLSPAKIAEKMGTKPFIVEKAMKHTGNFTATQLRKGFDSLSQTDRELKTSGKNPRIILESLILNLCSSR